MQFKEIELQRYVDNIRLMTGKEIELRSEVKEGTGTRLYFLVEMTNEQGGYRRYSSSMKKRNLRRAMILAMIVADDMATFQQRKREAQQDR